MHVGFYTADQNPHRDRTLGITVFTKNLIERLSVRAGLQITVLASRSSFRPESSAAQVRTIPLRTDNAFGRLLVDQLHPAMGIPKVDFWHYPKGFLPLLTQPKGPIVGTVNDVILQFYADHYPRARSTEAYRYWIGMLRRSIPRFTHILTISEFSKQRIQEFCQRYHLHCPPISVTYLAPQWKRSPDPLPAKENFVLHLASREPHKRTGTLLQLWSRLATKRRDLPALHLVGQIPNEQQIPRSLTGVQVFGRQGEEELKSKFLRARALIFPSEIEGFGLPVLEAFEMRTPVVFAAGTPVREILGSDLPGEFDLDSLESFEAALDAVLDLESTQIEAKANALQDQFSWDRCADQTVEVYRSVIENR